MIYEDERVRYVHATTGLDEGTVRAVLRSRDRYNLGLGVFPEELAQEGETPEGIRAEHPDFFPLHHIASRFVDARLEGQYVAIDSGIADADVRRISARFAARDLPSRDAPPRVRAENTTGRA